jgi:exopolyphosphatase / guanosine-5'-triphosphate,3'-diphosphate pyrophosphatase
MSKLSPPLAVIDVGSHSLLLLIGRVNEQGRIEVIRQQFDQAKLGAGIDHPQKLSGPAINRALQVMDTFKDWIDRHGVSEVHVIGTAALRRAINARDFIQRVNERYGWHVNILTADEEARYSYLGVIDGLNKEDRKYLVMDSGGGSTEIILGTRDGIEEQQSLDFGTLTLAGRMHGKIKLNQQEQKAVLNWITDRFKTLSFQDRIKGTWPFIVYGGSASTLAAIKEKMNHYDSMRINSTMFDRDELWQLFEALNDQTLAQRRALPGMEAGREEVLTYGALIILAFMEMHDLQTFRVSDRGLRFGYLLIMAGQGEIKVGGEQEMSAF